MNSALWKKAVSDGWLQLLVSCLLLALFGWVFVWLMSLFKLPAWLNLLNMMPDFVEPMIGIPIAELAKPAGRLSVLYVHALTLLPCVGWAVGRGSDVVSGQISRGTMEFLATLPDRRAWLLVPEAVVATCGAAMLAVAVWLGSVLGLSMFDIEAGVPVWYFLPGAVNLFAMTVCLTGLTTLISAFEHDRWRTIWAAGGLFVLSMIVDIVSRVWQGGWWLQYGTFLSLFDPQRVILLHSSLWMRYVELNWKLLGIGLVAYLAAAAVFTRRDIPVPR